MRRTRRIILALLLAPFAAGCVVRTAYHVATAPVRATAWTADRLTTSQAEADRNRGRRERRAEERQARADRRAEEARQRQAAAARRAEQAYPAGGQGPG